MSRAARAALVCLLMAGCAAPGAPNIDESSPFAPGVDRRKEAVDGTVVGTRLLAAKQYELALDAYTRAAAEQGVTPEILAGLGAANLGLGRLGQAESQLRKAVADENAAPETWNNLGMLLIDKGEVPEGVETLRRAFALSNGQNDEIRDNLRMALAMQGETGYDPELQQDLDLVQSEKGRYRLTTQFP